MTDRLKPCPFCGGEARITKLPKSVKPKAFHIGCSQCGAVKILFMTEEEAIRQWNTRKPMDRIVERLKEYQRNYSSGRGGFTDELVDRVLRNAIEIVKGEQNE